MKLTVYTTNEEFDGGFYKVWELEGWWWKERFSDRRLEFLWFFGKFCFNFCECTKSKVIRTHFFIFSVMGILCQPYAGSLSPRLKITGVPIQLTFTNIQIKSSNIFIIIVLKTTLSWFFKRKSYKKYFQTYLS